MSMRVLFGVPVIPSGGKAIYGLLLVTALAGCATPMGALDAPPKWCMTKGAAQEPLKAGDDLVQKHADLKEQSAKEQSKVRCLQRYAKAVTN